MTEYGISVEPLTGSTYTLAVTFKSLAHARTFVVNAFPCGPVRTIAIVTGRGRKRRLIDVYDGQWSQENLDAEI